MDKALAVAGVVLASVLSSCGGSSDAEASKALSASIMKSQRSGDNAASSLLSLDREEADCIATGMVDEIGTDQLQEYQVLTEDNKANKDLSQVKMSQGDAEAATDVLFGCTDVPATMKKALTSGGQVPAEILDCVTAALDEKALRALFTSAFAGEEAAARQQLVGPVTRCAASRGG